MDNNLPYWQDVLISLRRIIHATDLQSKRIEKISGLTIPQLMVLRSIEELGDVTLKRISDQISLSQATVTTILNRLEDRTLIERVRCNKDRRIVYARLTEKGQQVLADAPTLLHERFIENFENLEIEQKAAILLSLQQVAAMMDASSLKAAPILAIGAADKD